MRGRCNFVKLRDRSSSDTTITLYDHYTTVTCHQDGDSVVMTGLCRGEGYNVGFGSVEGVVLPALQ